MGDFSRDMQLEGCSQACLCPIPSCYPRGELLVPHKVVTSYELVVFLGEGCNDVSCIECEFSRRRLDSIPFHRVPWRDLTEFRGVGQLCEVCRVRKFGIIRSSSKEQKALMIDISG